MKSLYLMCITKEEVKREKKLKNHFEGNFRFGRKKRNRKWSKAPLKQHKKTRFVFMRGNFRLFVSFLRRDEQLKTFAINFMQERRSNNADESTKRTFA